MSAKRNNRFESASGFWMYFLASSQALELPPTSRSTRCTSGAAKKADVQTHVLTSMPSVVKIVKAPNRPRQKTNAFKTAPEPNGERSRSRVSVRAVLWRYTAIEALKDCFPRMMHQRIVIAMTSISAKHISGDTLAIEIDSDNGKSSAPDRCCEVLAARAMRLSSIFQPDMCRGRVEVSELVGSDGTPVGAGLMSDLIDLGSSDAALVGCNKMVSSTEVLLSPSGIAEAKVIRVVATLVAVAGFGGNVNEALSRSLLDVEVWYVDAIDRDGDSRVESRAEAIADLWEGVWCGGWVDEQFVLLVVVVRHVEPAWKLDNAVHCVRNITVRSDLVCIVK